METQDNEEKWEELDGLPPFFSNDDDDFTVLAENAINLEKQYMTNPVFKDEVDNMMKTINEEFDRLKEKCIAGFYTFRGLLDVLSESKGRKFVSENFDAIELSWKKSKAPKTSQTSFNILRESFEQTKEVNPNTESRKSTYFPPMEGAEIDF